MIVAGDVNIHTEKKETYSNKFSEILDMFNMMQHIDQPTHKMGHTLDIVTTFDKNPVISKIDINEYDISHHFLIDFNVTCSAEVCEYKMIEYRSTKNINYKRNILYWNQREMECITRR